MSRADGWIEEIRFEGGHLFIDGELFDHVIDSISTEVTPEALPRVVIGIPVSRVLVSYDKRDLQLADEATTPGLPPVPAKATRANATDPLLRT